MKKIFIYSILISLFITACENNDTNTFCSQNENAITISHDNITREYILYVPQSYSDQAVPLLFNFHGFGDTAEQYMNYVDMRSLAESEQFILVYPQGSCLNGASHWNPCTTGGDNKSTADDLGFVEAMIDNISLNYNIDSERVYASGYSNGGMMVYGLANYKSNLITAVASVSGAMLDCAGTISRPVPVIHLHGTSDGVIPFNGSSEYSSVQSTLDYWINFNNTSVNPVISTYSDQGISIEHYLYNDGDDNISVEHYKYVQGGHEWFNSSFQGQNTSELVWNFLSKYNINGLID